MAKEILYWRGTFNPAWDFVVSKMLTIEGHTFQVGDSFDKTLVSQRRLRQMLESRKLGYTVPKGMESPDKKRGSQVDLHRKHLEQWLQNEGFGPNDIDPSRLTAMVEATRGLTDDEIADAFRVAGVEAPAHAGAREAIAGTSATLGGLRGALERFEDARRLRRESTPEAAGDAGATTTAPPGPPGSPAPAPSSPRGTPRGGRRSR